MPTHEPFAAQSLNFSVFANSINFKLPTGAYINVASTTTAYIIRSLLLRQSVRFDTTVQCQTVCDNDDAPATIRLSVISNALRTYLHPDMSQIF